MEKLPYFRMGNLGGQGVKSDSDDRIAQENNAIPPSEEAMQVYI